MDAWKVAKFVVKYSNPVGALIADGVELAAKSMTDAANKGLDDLKAESLKQSIRAQFDQQQARTAQELAIAERISNADEVHIEEFCDTSGKGNLGVSLNGDASNVGIGASGRSVVKRTYRFTGWKQQEVQVVANASVTTP